MSKTRKSYVIEKAEYDIERVMRSVDMSVGTRAYLSQTLNVLKDLK